MLFSFCSAVFLDFFILSKFTGSSLTPDIERTTVHLSDDSGRITMLEKRTIGTDASLPELQRYVYNNHLQSASLELNEVAEIISYKEYHPYGTTAYQASNADINTVSKRYRYTGKERDEESGLYYHGARYYVPWLCRWTTVDPLESKYAGMSPYNYSFNNPVMFNDPSGMEGEKWGEEGRTYNGKPVRYGNLDTDRGVMNFTEGYNPDTGNFDIIAAEFAPDNVVQGEARDKGWFSLSANLQGGRWLDIRGISAPQTPSNLPVHRRPANLGGTGKDPVFQINTKQLPAGLLYLQDKTNHGTIQPAFPMSYETYKSLLSLTKLFWKPYGK